MKHNKLVERLLSQFAGDEKVFFKIPGSPTIIPVAECTYEVDNTLVFFKEEANEESATVRNVLCSMADNYYTSQEGEDEDFEIAISNIFEWADDDSGFGNLYSIVDAIQVDDKVILTTMPFYDDLSKSAMEKLTIVSTDRSLLDKFIEEIDDLRNSVEFSKSIHIC